MIFPLAFALFVAASAVIIGSPARSGLRASLAADRRGVRIAVIAGVAVSALLALTNSLLAVAYLVPLSREGFFFDYVLVPFLYLASLVSLAVLDSYAIWPLSRGKRAGAVARGVLSASVVVVVVVAIALVASTAAHMAEQAAQAKASDAVVARSEGLSLAVAVVDATLGETTANGRMVSRLTLDLTIDSSTDIHLRPTRPGLSNQAAWIGPPDAFSIQLNQDPKGLDLPLHIPAGFRAVYRVDVVVDTGFPPDRYTTGPWEASLQLIGPNDEAGSPVIYQTETAFTVTNEP